MSETLERQLQALWGEYEVPSLAGIKRRIAFIGPLASCGMAIDDGHVTLSPDISNADCVVRSDERALLMKLVMGEANLVTTLLQGRIAVEGDPMLAVEVAGSMPDLGHRFAEKLAAQKQEGETAWPATP